MESTSKHIPVLTRLGLNSTEAKIFLTLCKTGICTARSIAENSGIAREIVYQIIPTLLNKGLVETVVASPQAYKAIPAEHAYEILLKRKDAEKKELEKGIKESLKALRKIQKAKHKEEPQIAIIPQGKTLRLRFLKELKSAKKTIDIIMPWQKFLKLHHFYAKDEITYATNRNVRIRIITENKPPETRKKMLEHLLLKEPDLTYIDVRTATNANIANVAVFDDKIIVMAITEEPLLEGPTLYSNNPSITWATVSYFQRTWEKAIPLKETSRKIIRRSKRRPTPANKNQ